MIQMYLGIHSSQWLSGGFGCQAVRQSVSHNRALPLLGRGYWALLDSTCADANRSGILHNHLAWSGVGGRQVTRSNHPSEVLANKQYGQI
jgi:hypothetical protein